MASEGEFGGESDGGFHAVGAGEAATGDVETLRRWRASGRPEPAEWGGNTLLHLAALAGQEAAAAFLLDAGVDPNARNSAGSTPQDAAAIGCHLAAVRRLMARGAALSDMQNPGGESMPDFLSRVGATEVLPLLQR